MSSALILLLLFSFIILINSLAVIQNKSTCPCKNTSLCLPIGVITNRNLTIGFSDTFTNYQKYDWTLITTLVVSSIKSMPLNFVCYAHSKGVSLLLLVDPGINVVMNNSLHDQWTESVLLSVTDNFLDGINLNFQGPLSFDNAHYYTNLSNSTYSAFKVQNKRYQISINMPWSDDCIDGRCFDAYRLAKVSDYIIVMAFDVQSDAGKPPCFARASSPFYETLGAIVVYIEAGIASNKIIYGVPWYGYLYNCVSVSSNDMCQVELPPNASHCSNKVAYPLPYKDFYQYTQAPNVKTRWDNYFRTSYIMSYAPGTKIAKQGWCDDEYSLAIKVFTGMQMNLGGVAVFTLDSIDYNNYYQVNSMWGVLRIVNGRN